MDHAILFFEANIAKLRPLRLDFYETCLYYFELECKLERDSPYYNGGRYHDDFEGKFQQHFDIREKNFIVFTEDSLPYQKHKKLKQEIFQKYLKFIGKTFDEYLADMDKEYWKMRETYQYEENEVARYIRETKEFYQKREETEREAEIAAYRGVGTWKYPIWWFRSYCWDWVRRKINYHILYPLQFLLDREEREKWTRIANFNKEFDQAQEKFFQQRWDTEREQLRMLNEMVETTIMRGCGKYH